MLSASVASQIVFTSTNWNKRRAGESIKMTQIVDVQPGSIYLAIGAKTSSVRNIVVYGTWLVYVTGKIPYGRLLVFGRGKKFQVFISFGHHPTHNWVSLTDCKQHRTQRRGSGRVTRVLSTAHSWGSPALSVFDDTEKTVNTAGTV